MTVAEARTISSLPKLEIGNLQHIEARKKLERVVDVAERLRHCPHDPHLYGCLCPCFDENSDVNRAAIQVAGLPNRGELLGLIGEGS